MHILMVSLVALGPVLLFLLVLVYLDSFKLVSLRSVVGVLILGTLTGAAAYLLSGPTMDALHMDIERYSRFGAPVLEEFLKATAVIYLIARNRIGFMIDAAIMGLAIGAGFSLFENVYYANLFPDSNMAVFMVRGLGTAIMHGGTTAIFGVTAQSLSERHAVFNPLNSGYTAVEVGFVLGDAEPKVVVASGERIAEIGDTARKHGAQALLALEADGSGSLSNAARDAKPFGAPVARDADDLAALLYTSGTTGRPKGAMITHGNLLSNALALIQTWELTAGEALIHALPIYHVHGLFVALNTALLGGLKLLWHEKFDARAVLADFDRAQVMMGVPTFYTRLLAEAALTPAACAGLRLFVSGSAPLLPETHAAFRERTGHAILERYGMTETGMIASNPYRGERIAGSVGYALPGVTVRVAGAHGNELPRGETGMVEVNGPNVFNGYWRLPDKTRDEFRADGYFITGDQGVMAKDGLLTLVGRAKDLIITGGLNVYPIEIEQALNAVHGITDSAVIGVPHADFGEAVVAVVTTSDGSSVSEAEIIATLSRRLAKFKCPKRIVLVPELPRNSMGKVSKAELRERFKTLLH